MERSAPGVVAGFTAGDVLSDRLPRLCRHHPVLPLRPASIQGAGIQVQAEHPSIRATRCSNISSRLLLGTQLSHAGEGTSCNQIQPHMRADSFQELKKTCGLFILPCQIYIYIYIKKILILSWEARPCSVLLCPLGIMQ